LEKKSKSRRWGVKGEPTFTLCQPRARTERGEIESKIKIGRDSYIVVEGGKRLVKKCFRGLSSDVLEDVLNGVANWILLRDVHGVPKLIRFDSEVMCIFVEYIDGKNLREFIDEKGGKLSEYDASCIALRVARVLKVALDKGIVHRDLKPENIIVSEREKIWIVDWEYSVRLGSKPRSSVGTAPYYPPNDNVVSAKYDVYSLGIILQEMITGISSPRLTLAIENSDLRMLIERMKDSEPSSRASIKEVIETLSKICRE